MQCLTRLNMTAQQQLDILDSLVKGLKLKHGDLAILIETVNHQAACYDFFRTLATHIIPFIRKDSAYRTFVHRWTREIRAAKKELRQLKEKAVQEVTEAYDKISKRLEGSQLLTKIEGLQKSLDEAKGYLDGTLPVYLPSHFEMAAEALASVCSLLVANRNDKLVSDLVEIVYFKGGHEIGIATCNFYNTINKILKENQKWGRDSFDRPYVCWTYLCLAERCWKLEAKDFEGKSLKSKTIEDCKRNAELINIHSYWVQIQDIRNKRQKDSCLFTIERFSKYLEVICIEILTEKVEKTDKSFSTGVHALSLTLHRDNLLILIETNDGQTKTPYLLHNYHFESPPHLFMKELISHPNKDRKPSDDNMQSGSAANLLDRAKITDALRDVFIKKGSRKGSVQLTSPRVALEHLDLSTQLAITTQLENLNLSVYNPKGTSLPKELLN